MIIRGKDKNNTILLFVHGGSGCSEITYATKYQDSLEEDFTVVHYEQRASEKSYHFSQNILLKESFEKNLPNIVKSIDIPCYFFMGKYDYMTSTSAAKSYFDKLDVDKKEFIIYENSAHYPQFEEKEQFIKWIKDIFIKEE